MTDTPKNGENKKTVARQLYCWVEQPPLLMKGDAMISDWERELCGNSACSTSDTLAINNSLVPKVGEFSNLASES